MVKKRNLTVKEKILQTAEAMFVKKGFFPTTVEEIAKQAKIAKGTVYLYFPTKESIYLTIFENKLKLGIEIIEKVRKMSLSEKEKLSLIFDDWYNKIAQAKGLASFLTLENINLSPKIVLLLRKRIRPKIKKIFHLVKAIFEEGIRKKEFKEYDCKLLSILFLHLIQSALLLPFFGIKKDGQKIKEIFLKGVER
uniref:TetR/AcrR family transcriptional regulator n=1 Tax=candidate division WOR-3 bacterium TaxID=2052148 RepID=A0A7V3ZU71_UNCW3